ncbi:MAG: hypothetical protein AAGI88_12160 [Pseudomonadota bacterium]
MIAASVALAVLSAALTHIAVRTNSARFRAIGLGTALALFSLSLVPGCALGGFWPGFYSLLSVYFLTTAVTPWLSFFFSRRRDAR